MATGFPGTYVGPPRTARTSGLLGKDSILRRLDWALALATLGLCMLGMVLVYSATRQRMLDAGADPQAFLKRHILNFCIGVVLAAVAALIDYRSLRAYAPIVYVASILGLLAVLSPLGSTVKGAHSWIVLPGGFTVQPSEFAKVALVVGLSMILSEKRDAEDNPRDIDVVVTLAIAAVPLGLIMLQPDLGTAVVICCLLLGLIAVSGAPARWIVGLLLGAVLMGTGAVTSGLISGYQLDRIAAFMDPTKDPQGVGFNVRQAKIAVGSGGIEGQGLFDGQQTQGKFVPEQQTDFVFTVAAEELGFLGGGGLIALLSIVLWRAARIAANAEDLFGRLVAVGVLCWFTFQAFENIGMTLGIMPVTGVPLPFVSYGGSSMFANMMAVGLLQNVHMRRYV